MKTDNMNNIPESMNIVNSIINNNNTNDTVNIDPTRPVIRLEYTPPPMPEETREFIKRALAVPPNIPAAPHIMSDDTHALLDIILHIARLKNTGVIPSGTVKYN
jgi:hypothetical protein